MLMHVVVKEVPTPDRRIDAPMPDPGPTGCRAIVKLSYPAGSQPGPRLVGGALSEGVLALLRSANGTGGYPEGGKFMGERRWDTGDVFRSAEG